MKHPKDSNDLFQLQCKKKSSGGNEALSAMIDFILQCHQSDGAKELKRNKQTSKNS